LGSGGLIAAGPVLCAGWLVAATTVLILLGLVRHRDVQ
jgi:hypothetical protein